MAEMYETYYGIHDHRKEMNPLASVQYNASENFIDHYLFDSYLDVFLYKGIYKNTGLSFDDFLDRPRYEIEKIVRAVDGFSKKESAVSQDAIDKLNNINK